MPRCCRSNWFWGPEVQINQAELTPPLCGLKPRCVHPTGYVGHIFARISGCSLWNVIRKQSSCSPEAKPWYHHLSPILVISFLIIFTYQRLWGKVICMFLHAAFWVWCLNIQGADQKRNHEATIHPFPIYTVIPFWCTTHVVDKHDVHISAYNIVVSWSNGTM